MKNKHIGSDARDMIKDWERKEPTMRADIEKAKAKKLKHYQKKQK